MHEVGFNAVSGQEIIMYQPIWAILCIIGVVAIGLIAVYFISKSQKKEVL